MSAQPKTLWTATRDTRIQVPGLCPQPDQLPYWTDQVLSEEECDAIYYAVIAQYQDKQLSMVYSEDGSSAHVDKSSRYTHYYNPRTLSNFADIEARFTASCTRGLQTWLGETGKSAWPVYDSQILGYEERCMFRTHCDNSLWVNNAWSRNDMTRDLTGLLYISESVTQVVRPNQFAGGELILDNILMDQRPVTFRPRKGQLVMFPAHPMYVHQVQPVTAGYRVGFVNWFTAR